MSIVTTASMLLLLVAFQLQEGCAVKLFGKSQVQTTHPGHAPYHVTRLHRYDHEGLDSFLEEEAKWERSTTAPETASSSMIQIQEEEQPFHGDFLRLSPTQIRGLRQHHAYLQTQERTRSLESKTFKSGAGLSVFADMTSNTSLGPLDIRDKVRHDHANHPGLHDGFAATGLWSLSSQYVGPIGVGTVVEPANCVLNKSRPLMFMPKSQSAELIRNSSFLESRQQCHITDESQVWVVYDTGSTNIWISSDLCKTGPCANSERHRYNHTVSATFDSPKSLVQLTVQFGTGRIMGPQAVDDLHIGPFTVYNQTFAMIEVEQGSVFEELPVEGIVGLAYPAMSANGAKPFFDTVVDQGALRNNEFAFYFSRDKPAANAILWGGVDPTFYKGDITYYPVVDPYYWSIKLKSFSIGDKEFLGAKDMPKRSAVLLQTHGTATSRRTKQQKQQMWQGPYAILDTGTTFFTAETDKYQQIMDRVPSARCNEVTDESHPPITFRLEDASGEDRDFTLTNRHYMTASGHDEDAMCTTAFMPIDIPKKHGPAMVLGEVFMRRYFTVFDRQDGVPHNGRVGIAESSQEPNTERQIKMLTKGQPSFTAGVGSQSAEPELQ